MPSDIRSFFGGKAAAAPAAEKKADQKPALKKGRGARKVVEDSDEEDVAVKPPKAGAAKKHVQRAPSPEGEVTSTSDYFASKDKPKQSAPSRAAKSQIAAAPSSTSTPAKVNGKASSSSGTPSKRTTPNSRGSARTKAPATYAEDLDDDDFAEIMHVDDVPKTNPTVLGKDMKSSQVDGGNDEDDEPVRPRRARGNGNSNGKQVKLKDDDFDPDEDVDMRDTNPDDDFVVPDEDEEIVKDEPVPKKAAKPSAKRKAVELSDHDEDDESEAPKKKTRKATAPAKKAAPKKAKEQAQDSAEILAIMNSIDTVRAPTPPPPSDNPDEKRKFPFGGPHANSAPPPAADTKEIPEGAENCLAGLTFVFTGQLETLGREKGQALVKRYGGKVTTGPSKKTNFIVLGDDAGPSKLRKIREMGLTTINEDGLYQLIARLPANGGDSKAAAQNAATKAKEEEKIQKMAEEMEEQDKKDQKERKAQAARTAAASSAQGGKAAAPAPSKGKEAVPDTRLWTVKYAPQALAQICGNTTQVQKLQRWLQAFPKNQRTKFKMPGADGSGLYRAVIIHGPPGIGKTTAAHLVAKLEGYDVVESNASDTRSKKLVEQGLKGVLSTTSLLGYFAGDGKAVEEGKKKLVLIMDEVDGMSAGDRGGVGALAAVCKKSQIPMILICNDRKQPKMKPFDFVTYDMPFRRPTTDQIRGRIMTIMYREGMKMPPQVVNALIDGSGADIRQIVNMVSTAKLDQSAIDSAPLDFDSGKQMSKAWEKHVILKPWDITSKILGGGMFAPSSEHTLNDKIELYFNDHEFSYLMLQENYLGTNPILANQARTQKEKSLKVLELASKAADSISDGDLVDRMIHGSQQQWSLMPAHAIFSFVRPASLVSGSMAGHQTRFTSWLGKNSAQGKLTRMVKEIQGHMRLRTTGDRHEVRQQYLPLLWQNTVKKMEIEGKDAVDPVIDLMDSYFLTRDDFDAIMELGVGPMNMENVKLESQTKSTFTRLYNQRSHPLPFMKASSVMQPKVQSRAKPDLEEAIEESDEGEVIEEKKEGDEETLDLSKDKYVKAPKKKKAPAKSTAKAAGKGKKRKGDESDEESEVEEEKPKKGKGKAAPKGKAKK